MITFKQLIILTAIGVWILAVLVKYILPYWANIPAIISAGILWIYAVTRTKECYYKNQVDQYYKDKLNRKEIEKWMK